MEGKEVSFNREVIQEGQTEQLRKLCEGMEELTGQADTVGHDRKAAYAECLETIRQKRAAAEARLTEMRQDGSDGFYELSLTSQIALDELKEAVCFAQEALGSPAESRNSPAAASAQAG
jgi:hypothetical protein